MITYLLGADLHRDAELQALLREAKAEPRLLSFAMLVAAEPDHATPSVLMLGVGRQDNRRVARRVRQLREHGVGLPVLLVAQSDAPDEIAAALEAGANDFVRRASARAELGLRLRALERRSARLPGARAFRLGDVEVDRTSQELRRGGRSVALTTREYRLLEYLAEHHGKPVPRQRLAEHVWGHGTRRRNGSNVVNVYIAYLRKKLSAVGVSEAVRTLRGVGYTITADCRTIER